MRTSETVATRLLPAARIVLGSTRPRRADSAAVARLVPACCCSVKFSIVVPEQLQWLTRPHEPGEPARHVAELQPSVGFRDSRANVWRYEPGARGKRHVHDEQEETFVVLAGRLTMLLGDPPERHEAPVGGVVHVRAGTPLQTVNDGEEDLVVYAYRSPPDDGAEVLSSAV